MLKDYEEEPKKKTIHEGYGGNELRFRKFLYLSTLIGLDLINSNIIFSGQPLKSVLEKNSQTYIQLSDDLKNQLWEDFKLSGYAHMFKNMMQISF